MSFFLRISFLVKEKRCNYNRKSATVKTHRDLSLFYSFLSHVNKISRYARVACENMWKTVSSTND